MMTLWITESIPPADGQQQSPAAVPSLTAIAMEQLENKSLDNIVLDCRKSCPWSPEHILAAADLLREAGVPLVVVKGNLPEGGEIPCYESLEEAASNLRPAATVPAAPEKAKETDKPHAPLPHVTPTRPISVAVLGSQSRIGCTTQAIQLWYFFTAIGYRAAIVANAAWLDELAALENSPYDDMVKIRGVVFVSENADTGDYNCIIRDWGVIDEVSKEAAADADLCVLVVGCKRWELVQTTNAIVDAGGMADLVMIAFGANQVAQQDIEKILLKASTPRQTVLTRYTPEPFRPGLLDIFKPLLEALYDKGGI